MTLCTDLAVVLQVRDHGDSDKIVVIFSRKDGKIAMIAKGAKRSKKRFVNKLEPFSLLSVQYAPGRTSTLMRLDQADLLAPYPLLREDYRSYVAASLLCELVLHWTREQDSDEELFHLLVWALEGLSRKGPAGRTIVFFHLGMLAILGYRPFLSGCLDCRSLSAANAPYRFSPLRNGLICSRCEPVFSAGSLPVSIQTAQLLRKAQEMDRNKLDRLHFSRSALAEALAMLSSYDSHLLQRELNSWKFLA
jgi:DNA repair protein RecO (recombination protein O)